MFANVVVGVDGRDGGADAIALARALAAPDAQILLVNAYPYEDERPSEGAIRAFEELLLSEARARLEALTGADERLVPRPVACISPARALHAEAARVGADLIVVGSCRRGAAGRALLGDVSRSVLHGATCPVAVAPRGLRDATPDLETVGVGVDEGDAARAALDLASRLAAELGARLRLLAAVHGPVPFSPADAYAFDWPAVLDEQRKTAHALLDELAAGVGVPVSTEVVEGTAAVALEALSHEVDLLVLGSRGWGAVKRVVLGSTADRVIHVADCPVLLAPVPS